MALFLAVDRFHEFVIISRMKPIFIVNIYQFRAIYFIHLQFYFVTNIHDRHGTMSGNLSTCMMNLL